MRSSYQNTDLASKTILFSKRMMKFVLLLAFLALAVAFNTAPTRSGRMAPSMLFGGGKKKAAASAPTGKGKKSTSPGANTSKGGYVPDGLSPEQYAQMMAADEAKAAKQRAKFPKGKTVETLNDWMEDCAKKGLKGKGLLKGHRMVKAKDPNWYTDESPV